MLPQQPLFRLFKFRFRLKDQEKIIFRIRHHAIRHRPRKIDVIALLESQRTKVVSITPLPRWTKYISSPSALRK